MCAHETFGSLARRRKGEKSRALKEEEELSKSMTPIEDVGGEVVQSLVENVVEGSGAPSGIAVVDEAVEKVGACEQLADCLVESDGLQVDSRPSNKNLHGEKLGKTPHFRGFSENSKSRGGSKHARQSQLIRAGRSSNSWNLPG